VIPLLADELNFNQVKWSARVISTNIGVKLAVVRSLQGKEILTILLNL
jgi:predicted cobalt transporter CbtA